MSKIAKPRVFWSKKKQKNKCDIIHAINFQNSLFWLCTLAHSKAGCGKDFISKIEKQIHVNSKFQSKNINPVAYN